MLEYGYGCARWQIAKGLSVVVVGMTASTARGDPSKFKNSFRTTTMPFDLGQQIMWLIYRILFWTCLIALGQHCAVTNCAAEQEQIANQNAFGFPSAAAAAPAMQPTPATAFSEIGILQYYGLAFKLFLCTAILLGTCVAFLLWRRRHFKAQPAGGADHRLRVVDSMSIAPGVNVKLIHVGSQRVLVGHDRHGLKELLLIHEEFEELVQTADRLQPPFTPLDQGNAQAETNTFANPKDDGWVLNRLTT